MIPHSAGRSAGLMLRLMGERMLGLDFFLLAGGLGVGVDGPWCCFLGEAEEFFGAFGVCHFKYCHYRA